MTKKLLLDTDVLIDYLRGQEQAVAYLEILTEHLLISSITVAELYAGVREGNERKTLDEFINAFDVVMVSKEITQIGGLYRRHYAKSHKIGLADAVIAATADLSQATLVTLNREHYPMLESVILPYRK
ncbi:MAG: type II toxin-antitoxin system VapC family toxin [Synechococcaceae cyanobacterium SM2_3_2]|nr:type II toxin-antitoxin system VapC family toxin [Synechococcaceae cyanobacterium SM2_3_2]